MEDGKGEETLEIDASLYYWIYSHMCKICTGSYICPQNLLTH